MPRLDRMGVDRRTLDRLASLRVPITLAESLLSRDAEQLAMECRVDVRRVNELRYLVALRCQPQPPVLDRRLSLSNVGGHDGEGAGDAVTSSSSKSERERAACLDRGEGTGDNLTLSFVSADSLYRQAREVGGFVTTGSDSLDQLLCKGLMLHHVVEVVGRSSSGKTQLCLTAAVAAASHGIGVLYMDTSNGCNVRRMQQIARSRYADVNGEMTARQMDALLDRLRVIRAFDITTVMSALVSYIDGVTEGGPDGIYSDCRLVILDSATAVVSPLLGGAKNPDGHGLMTSLGHLLNKSSSQCSACVLVANTSVVSSEEEGPRAALGATWEGVPSIRLMLSDGPAAAVSGAGIGHGYSAVSMRTATVLKHPAQACGKTAAFAIGDGGVVDVHR